MEEGEGINKAKPLMGILIYFENLILAKFNEFIS